MNCHNNNLQRYIFFSNSIPLNKKVIKCRFRNIFPTPTASPHNHIHATQYRLRYNNANILLPSIIHL